MLVVYYSSCRTIVQDVFNNSPTTRIIYFVVDRVGAELGAHFAWSTLSSSEQVLHIYNVVSFKAIKVSISS